MCSWAGCGSFPLGEKSAAAAQRDMFSRLIYAIISMPAAFRPVRFNFVTDATLMRDAITQGVAAIFLESVTLIGLLLYALISDWQLGLLILVIAAVGLGDGAPGRFHASRLAGMREAGDLTIAPCRKPWTAGIIKAYGLEGHAVERVDGRLKSRLKTLLKAVRLRAAAAPVSDIFLGATVALVLFVAGWQDLHGQITFNTFLAFTVALLLPPAAGA